VTNAMIRKEAKINGPIEFHGDFLWFIYFDHIWWAKISLFSFS
jgi:hypothetical protein